MKKKPQAKERVVTNMANVLRLYRAVNQRPIRSLAPDMGLSVATLSRIERGHAMDADTMVRVLNWLMRPSREASR
jgi:uncharacterized protein YerC